MFVSLFFDENTSHGCLLEPVYFSSTQILTSIGSNMPFMSTDSLGGATQNTMIWEKGEDCGGWEEKTRSHMIIKAVSSFFSFKQYQLLSSMVSMNLFASASGLSCIAPWVSPRACPTHHGAKQRLCVRVCARAPSCLILCDPVDRSSPDSTVPGIFQAKYWSGLPFPTPMGLLYPGTELSSLASPELAGRFFTTAPSGKPQPCPWREPKLPSPRHSTFFLSFKISLLLPYLSHR